MSPVSNRVAWVAVVALVCAYTVPVAFACTGADCFTSGDELFMEIAKNDDLSLTAPQEATQQRSLLAASGAVPAYPARCTKRNFNVYVLSCTAKPTLRWGKVRDDIKRALKAAYGSVKLTASIVGPAGQVPNKNKKKTTTYTLIVTAPLPNACGSEVLRNKLRNAVKRPAGAKAITGACKITNPSPFV